jgi:fibro-slime domain-containing protein
MKMHRHKGLALGCKENWANPVYVTKGMVLPDLYKPTPDPLTWVPVRNDATPLPCHSDFFNQHWWQDDPSQNRTIRASMILKRGAGNTYVIDSKDMPGGAYFPLDAINQPFWENPFVDINVATFGAQNLDLWCPPYGPLGAPFPNWQHEGGKNENGPQDEKSACTVMLANGGTKSFNATVATINAVPSMASRLHNYAFTMMGYTQFKYNPGDVFEFAGDDDMWIFIDGKLVADLGGTHPPAETRIDMDQLAAYNGWAPKSSHDLHFYYADRQTNGSNLRITTTLNEVIDVPWGAPKIKTANPLSGGNEFLMDVNNELAPTTLAAMVNSGPTGYFPIVVKKKIVTDTSVTEVMMGLWVKSIERVEVDASEKGIIRYKLDGVLCGELTCLNDSLHYRVATGDSIAFNYYANDGHGFEMKETDPPIMNVNGKPVKSMSLAIVGSSFSSVQATSIKPTDNSVVRPEMPNVKELFENGGTAGNGVSYPALGAKGEVLPKNKTGELLLTLYPSDGLMLDSALKDGFGMPPLANTNHAIVSRDGSSQYAVGPTPEMSVAHCVSQPGRPDKYWDNSCLGLGFTVTGPFKVNVQVYDHLGHFVSTYQAGVDAETMRLVQKNNLQAGANACEAKYGPPVKSGKVFANVNIYPFSQTGRKLGSGVYILKIDMITEPSAYCDASTGNNAVPMSNEFGRSFQQIKVAFMRQKTGK